MTRLAHPKSWEWKAALLRAEPHNLSSKPGFRFLFLPELLLPASQQVEIKKVSQPLASCPLSADRAARGPQEAGIRSSEVQDDGLLGRRDGAFHGLFDPALASSRLTPAWSDGLFAWPRKMWHVAPLASIHGNCARRVREERPNAGLIDTGESERLAAIIVPSLVGGLLLIGLVIFGALKVRERRQTEGTYRPSNEEQVGARVVTNANLQLPPEERLI
ncbi:hypothetical protein KIL84_021233 [Mauremys mutica]|uniref:Uncharacterized protein n=1 Tax=Mauremys mutica TaxID=74926 RepID=A0A9D3X712_9SAUR|nr:hypothetical protein KIL84_021233 [Mauremys mutica]